MTRYARNRNEILKCTYFRVSFENPELKLDFFLDDETIVYETSLSGSLIGPLMVDSFLNHIELGEGSPR